MSGAFSTVLWAKGRMARHNLASVRHESKLKIAVVGTAAFLIWWGLLVGFLRGFLFLQTFMPESDPDALNIGDLLMARLLSVFSLALFFMLIFSNVLIAFSTLYKAREVRYLLCAPVSYRTFFLSRLVECISFSSWASAYLGSPLILAYGITTQAHLGYYLAAILFYIPFVTIPAAIGAMITLVLVRVFPTLPRASLFVLAGAAIFGLFVYLRRVFSPENFTSDVDLLNLVITTAGQTQSSLLPSYWAAQGLLSSAHADFRETIFLFLVLLSNALFITWLGTELAQRWFLPGFSATLGSTTRRRLPGKGILGRLDGWLWFLKDPIHPLVVKDLKLFWRDPTQWTQFVVFFGIMAVYIANLGNRFMTYQSEGYRNFVVVLNTAACLLILASLTSRFVYPLISLEGFRFWILGLAPLTLRQLVWQKFWLSVATTAPFTIGLVVLSCWLLGVEPVRFAVAVYTVFLANLTLAGLAVGLGSVYPNFQEDNPARIVSGMGGTLNFLLSVGYITIVVISQGFIFQGQAIERYFHTEFFWWALAAILAFNTLLSLAAMLLPMRLGLRNLQRLEF